jgi:hypothetical protein
LGRCNARRGARQQALRRPPPKRAVITAREATLAAFNAEIERAGENGQGLQGAA